MTKKFPTHPANPERLCWGCDKYCAANAMMCGNGSDRTQHPFELFGPDWRDWGSAYTPQPVASTESAQVHAGAHCRPLSRRHD